MVVAGLIVLMIGRSLNTRAEDGWKEQFRFREALFGPPGYSRAIVTLSGILLMIIGLAGLTRGLISLIAL